MAVEYGYGHKQLGAVSHRVDGQSTPANPAHGNGVNLNSLGFADPTRPAADNVWIDWVSGAVVRQGLPVKVVRL
ncbi:Tetrathionate reductase subunit A precursor [compost metagenome]